MSTLNCTLLGSGDLQVEVPNYTTLIHQYATLRPWLDRCVNIKLLNETADNQATISRLHQALQKRQEFLTHTAALYTENIANTRILLRSYETNLAQPDVATESRTHLQQHEIPLMQAKLTALSARQARCQHELTLLQDLMMHPWLPA